MIRTHRFLPLLAFALFACGDGGVVIEATSTTRANIEDEQGLQGPQLLLTIREIHAHVVGGPKEEKKPRKRDDRLEWKTKKGHWRVARLERPHTIDLLELEEKTVHLGSLDLPEGKITQIRLFLDEEGPNEYVRADGTRCPLHIPSANQTGIKIIKPFKVEVDGDEVVHLVIDFNLKESIRKDEGCSYRLSPVFKVRVRD